MLCVLSSWADLQYPLAQEAASLHTAWIIGAKNQTHYIDMMQWVFMAHPVFLVVTIGLPMTAAMEADKVGAWWVEIWDLRQEKSQQSQKSGLQDLSQLVLLGVGEPFQLWSFDLWSEGGGVYEWVGDRHCSIMFNLSKHTWHTWIYVAENPQTTGSNRVLTWAGSHPRN